MSDQLPKAALHELAEDRKREFGRALTRIWPLRLESFELSAATAKSFSELESTLRGFINDAVDLVPPSLRAKETFALIDDEVAWLFCQLEEQLADRHLCASSGVVSPQALQSDFHAIRARIEVRLKNSIPEQRSVPKPINKGGHPGKWNWEGALIHLIAVANQPDGLPEGPGAQTRIVELMADWFAIHNDGTTPADSDIKKRARLIIEEIGR